MTHDTWIFRAGAVSVAATFAIETAVNALFGYRIAGVPLMAVSMAIAVFGALLGVYYRNVRGSNGAAWLRRACYAVPFLACVAFSQWAGWSVFATLLADGAVSEEARAVQGQVARAELDRLRGLQRKSGLQRPVAQIEAEIAQQLAIPVRQAGGKTVGAITGDCDTKPGWAPSACARVAKLRAELAAASAAADLPKAITAALARVQAAPKVAGGDPHLAFASRVLGGLPPDDVRFWFTVFVVGLIGFVANFGPALLGIGVGDHPILSAAVAPPHDGGMPARFASGWGGPYQAMLPPQPPTAPHPTWVHPMASVPAHMPQHTAMHGAPISINLMQPVDSGHGHAQRDTPARSGRLTDAGNRNLTAPLLSGPTVHLPAPIAPDRPVSRASIQALMDQLAVFEAACLEPSPGALIEADVLFARYAQWAGPRAMPRQTFIDTVGEYTAARRIDFGGAIQFGDVALRESGALQLVQA